MLNYHLWHVLPQRKDEKLIEGLMAECELIDPRDFMDEESDEEDLGTN